jgi:hypothetical protein
LRDTDIQTIINASWLDASCGECSSHGVLSYQKTRANTERLYKEGKGIPEKEILAGSSVDGEIWKNTLEDM